MLFYETDRQIENLKQYRDSIVNTGEYQQPKSLGGFNVLITDDVNLIFETRRIKYYQHEMRRLKS